MNLKALIKTLKHVIKSIRPLYNYYKEEQKPQRNMPYYDGWGC